MRNHPGASISEVLVLARIFLIHGTGLKSTHSVHSPNVVLA